MGCKCLRGIAKGLMIAVVQTGGYAAGVDQSAAVTEVQAAMMAVRAVAHVHLVQITFVL